MQDTFNHELENNVSYMLEMLRVDYKNYFNASYSLRKNPIFILESIYQCMSQINNNEEYSDPEHIKKIYKEFCRSVSQGDYSVTYTDGYRVVLNKKNRRKIFKR